MTANNDHHSTMHFSIRKQWVTILMFVLSCLNWSYAQIFFSPGYVVLLNGDTLKGEVRANGNQAMYFRTNDKESPQTYMPGQIRNYFADQANHVSVTLTEASTQTAYFMDERVNGYVSLYQLANPEGRLTHAIQLPDKSFVPLRGNLTLLVLTNSLTECKEPVFTRLLDPNSFYRSDFTIERIIKTYNQCVKPTDPHNYSRPKKRFRFEAGLSVLAMQNTWVYSREDKANTVYYNPNGTYSALYTATVGAFFTIVPQERLSLGIEIFATHYKGSLLVPLTDPLNISAPNERTYTFEEHYVTLPIVGRYVFLNKATRWYIKAGVAPTLTTSKSGYFTSPLINLDVPFLSKSNIGVGYLAGIGADIALNSKRHLYVELRMVPHSVLDGVTYTAKSQSYQLMISLPLVKHQ